ncbi:RICIN domain-containing protein [uncultured Sphingomonas sp.]|uniref:RICIN domain-containing protein n=1 Tax=uncultured Sphingomonas sp. TaxID=158754 RepID=UPI00374A42C7
MWIRTATLVGMAALLASCGGDGGSATPSATGGVSLAPAAAPTPSPSPSPSPTPLPTPSPSPSRTPTPTSTPTAIEPYALGTLGYTLAPDIPAGKLEAIRDAMTFAISHANTLGAFSGNVYVVFDAGVPTADATYRGTIRFGGMIGRRVALHELAHWLGSGSTDRWDRYRQDGRFTGAQTVARIKAYKGADAFLNADRMHFWPYGLNYDDEFSDTQRNTQLVSAQLADMGLGADATAAIAGTRRFQNRSSGHVLQSMPSATYPVEDASIAGATQQWRVAFADGFITLTSVADGRTIEAAATGDNVAAVMATARASAAQQWEMMPTGDGWFLLRNRQTGNCLDNIGDLTPGASVRLWGCGWHPNQQWRLIR